MTQTFEVDFDEEICCDLCLEVVHFHMDECPVCLKKRPGTNQYQSVLDCIEDGGAFTCEECNSKFKILEYDYFREPKEALIELI